MKPSFSHSDRAGSELFGAVFAHGGAAREVGDAALLQAMLDAEAALARAAARAGLVSAEAAKAVSDAARADRFDLVAIGDRSVAEGNPIPALVRALREAVPRDAASAVHVGATSQDVIDTALMLVAKRSLGVVLGDLDDVASRCAALAERHSATLMVGRTLLTPALPITFGLKAALWLDALDGVTARLRSTRRSLPLQLGGAAGTLASLGGRALDVRRLLAEELGLVEPAVPWHAFRLPVLELGSALASVAAVLGKVARDVTLLAQPEVGELTFPSGSGGSSTLPQKANPIAAVAVLACTRRVPGLLGTLYAASEQEHERAAGSWHAEWETLLDVVRLVGSAAAWARETVQGMRVEAERMRTNLDGTGGALLAERVASLLAPATGPIEAHELVRRAAIGARGGDRPFIDTLFEDSERRRTLENAGLDRDAARRALDPSTYLGSADAFIDRVLSAHRSRIAEWQAET